MKPVYGCGLVRSESEEENVHDNNSNNNNNIQVARDEDGWLAGWKKRDQEFLFFLTFPKQRSFFASYRVSKEVDGAS